MREIGGYIEFEQYNLPMLHEDAIGLNCGRNCLAYLIEAKKISKIILPYFLCDSIRKTCIRYNVAIRYYSIDEMFLPIEVSPEEDEWIYIVNYYGQLTSDHIQNLRTQYGKVIVDYAQAYFDVPIKDIDSLYTCRKFFGVADGAFLYTNSVLKNRFILDESFKRMNYLLGRYEKTAGEFYTEYVENNKTFEKEPIKLMSKLTRNLLHSFDYERIKKIRTDNYTYLFKELNGINHLKLRQIEGAFAYPLMLENAHIVRKRLIDNKIYIPILWPNVLQDVEQNKLEYQMADKILPLPCDQRYGTKELEYMCEVIKQQ